MKDIYAYPLDELSAYMVIFLLLKGSGSGYRTDRCMELHTHVRNYANHSNSIFMIVDVLSQMSIKNVEEWIME